MDALTYKIKKYTHKLYTNPENIVYKRRLTHYRDRLAYESYKMYVNDDINMKGGTYMFSDTAVIPALEGTIEGIEQQKKEAYEDIKERNERAYARIKTSFLKYIAGPIQLNVLTNGNKTIMLFGESHIVRSKYKCGLDDEIRALHFTEFLYYLMRECGDKIFDVFVEDTLYSDRLQGFYLLTGVGSYGPSGVLSNLEFMFAECRMNLKDRGMCRRDYPNMRYHLLDPRKIETEKEGISLYEDVFRSFEYLFTFGMAIVDIVNKNITSGETYDNIMKAVKNVEENIISDTNKWLDIIFDLPDIKKQYERSSISDLKEKVKTYYIQHLAKDLTKYKQNNGFTSTSPDLFEREEIAYYASLIYMSASLDIYAIGRLFKKIQKRDKYKGELYSADEFKNVIFYTGYAHSNLIQGFLESMGFVIQLKYGGGKPERESGCIDVGMTFMEDIRKLFK